MENKKSIENNHDFKRTGSDKANQLGPSSPYERSSSGNPQADAAGQSADNDMDRISSWHNLEKDADEAQSDGNLGFPPGK